MTKNKKPNEFRVRLCDVGNNDFHASYEKMSGKYALEVCNTALIHMLKDMVGKDNVNKALYLMSVYILENLDKKFNERFPELKDSNVEEYLKSFEIVENN